jgi:hypothetical protein
MKRETWISFAVPLLAAAVLRIGTAAEMVFRPDGWNAFEPENRHWANVISASAATVGLIAVIALVMFAIWRLRIARRKWAAAGAVTLSLVCAVALFFVGIGEPYVKLYLHRSRYDAVVRQRPNGSLVVFDWGETAQKILGRTLEYLVFARGDDAVLLREFQVNDNGGVEADIQQDEIAIRNRLADAWDNPATREGRFKVLVLDSCRMNVHHLAGGYFYIIDDC